VFSHAHSAQSSKHREPLSDESSDPGTPKCPLRGEAIRPASRTPRNVRLVANRAHPDHLHRMMRLWFLSYVRPSRIGGAAALSVLAHLLLISVSVDATRPPDSMPDESIANRVYYIPPPDREAHAFGSRESVQYIALASGAGAGVGPVSTEGTKIVRSEPTPTAGNRSADTTTTPPPVGDPKGDSVFTVLEVDSAAVRSLSSASPAYPLDLLKNHIEGTVKVRFIVDTTGFADTTSLEILNVTNEGFVKAVREALPYMRFSAAKIGTMKVRQLVEQPFTFRIATPPPTPGKP
jgi:TonB family protein